MSETQSTNPTPDVEENTESFAKVLGKTFATNTAATAGLATGLILITKAGQLFNSRRAKKSETPVEAPSPAE